MDSNPDVLIVGAGISGISMAAHMKMACPARSFAIAERRDNLGGTWDLFKYPGIRSDSDMHSFGFRFEPWIDEQSIADGKNILDYLNRVVDERGDPRAHRLRAEGAERRLEFRRSALASRAGRLRRQAPARHPALPLSRLRLLRLRRSLRRPVRRQGRASRAGSSTRNSGPTISTTRARRW